MKVRFIKRKKILRVVLVSNQLVNFESPRDMGAERKKKMKKEGRNDE